MPNNDDDFRQFSYVNGLKIPEGGNHINLITDNVVSRLREKLQRKYKNIKPGDIKNKLMVVAFITDFPNPKFASQTKERLTNNVKELNEFIDVDWDKFSLKIYKNQEILDPITEVYRIKEELKRRKELQSLNKTKKKIKSDKYLPATKRKDYLMICEGDSAVGGLSPVLGRSNIGYYALKGKPLNVYGATSSKFTANKELSELYQIILNEGYKYIVFATDQDLDGYHIRGLLSGFINQYLPNFKDRIGILNTPVIGVKKGKKLTKWYYNLNDDIKINKGEVSKYYKGLGSWKESDLKIVVQKDGISKMVVPIEFNDDGILDDWLNPKKADTRKEMIMENEFNIVKL
jgi:DNA topoisomerase-2